MIVMCGCSETNPVYSIALLSSYFDRVKKQTISPSAFIRSVSYEGLVTIGFNTTMKPPDEIQSIKNSTIVINETTWPALSIYVIPGKFSDAKQLAFDWSVEKFSPGLLQIRLRFDYDEQVSSR